jgi:hypothetical protein
MRRNQWVAALAAMVLVVTVFTGADLAGATGRGAPPTDPPRGWPHTPPDYLNDDFTIERILDWGDRPVFSPDAKRLAFIESDRSDSHAYELDLATGKVRCLTCQFGPRGLVARIYYLPDDSFLVLGRAGLETNTEIGTGFDAKRTELYWMPASADTAPKALGASAIGEIAHSRHLTHNGVLIGWGACDVDDPGTCPQNWTSIWTGQLVHDGTTAELVDRTRYDGGGETYGFFRDDRSLTFWQIDRENPPGNGNINGEMYELDLTTGARQLLYDEPHWNEMHLFPGAQFGLEELNVLPVQERLFDLYVRALDGSNQTRRLTFLTEDGGQAQQSTPAPDGRRIAFVLRPPPSGEYAGEGGMYIGTFCTPHRVADAPARVGCTPAGSSPAPRSPNCRPGWCDTPVGPWWK